MAWTSDAITNAMSALSSQISQRETMATSALSRGALRLQQQEYALALREFQIAAAYKPDLPDAQIYLGRTYEIMGRTEDAINSYQHAIRLDPSRSDAVELLASLYMTSGRYAEAEPQLKQLIRLDPTAADPIATLGYAYLNSGRPDEAEMQFMKAIRLAPRDASSYYNLGVVYNQQGQFTEAIRQFEQAIDLDRNYAMAHSELAYAYLGLDQPDQARDQLDTLRRIDTTESNALADELANAIYTPKILINDAVHSTFDAHLGPGTPLEQLDPALATPGATVTFSMVFLFNKKMDLASVQKYNNWWISKASGGEGGVYNYGANLHPSDEVSIAPLPKAVRYDPLNYRATVYFTITQNASGTGVIDPSHWVFRFRGSDAEGKLMDHRGDQYDGAARGAF